MNTRKFYVKVISLLMVIAILPSSVLAEPSDETGDPTEETGTSAEDEANNSTTGNYYYVLNGDGTYSIVYGEPAPVENDPTFTPDTEGLGGFVARLYTTVLSREAEHAGYEDWCSKLSRGEMNGREVAEGFFESQEFLNKTLSNEEYLTILYRLFFNREPDPEGIATWTAKLEEGVSRTDIRTGFYDSAEWANTCLAYGIKSGGNGTATEIPDPTEGMITFVKALYSECLGREADDWGLNQWTHELAAQTMTGKQVAYGFFFSQEFLKKADEMTPEELITVFYTVFLDRTPDEYGMSYWKDKLSWGIGVEGLFTGFADSSEFKTKCANYGVICGEHIDVGSVEFDSDFIEFASWGSIRTGIERLDSVTNLYPHNFYTQYDVKSATTTSQVVYISEREIKVIEKFAASHFQPSWTPGQKVAYTLWWIHMNVRYANSSAAWSAIGGAGYAEAVFERRAGQCAQYNGALIEMMCWLGYDANMILGSRGRSGGVGAQHFWGEVTIDGQVYVMESGNYGDYPYWLYFCALYSETSKYIKNTVLMG